MKKIITLLTYILLIFTIFVVPISTTAFTIDFSNIFSDSEETETQLPNSVSITPLSNKKDLFSFAIDSSRPIKKEVLDSLNLKLIMLDYKGRQQTFTLKDLEHSIDSKNLRHIYHIAPPKLDKNTLYQTTHYTLDVSFMDQSLKNERSVFLPFENFKPNGIVKEDIKETLIPIYYTSDPHAFSIPVYTALANGKNFYRRMLNTLNTIPDYKGISIDSTFPRAYDIRFSAGVLQLKFRTPDLTIYADEKVASLALANLLKSFKVQNRELTVNKIAFIIDNTTQSKAFGNIDISKEFEIKRLPSVYLPYLNHENITWVPFDLQETDEITVLANQILEGFKSPYALAKNDAFVALLPQSVNLKNVQVIGKTLKLYFDDDLIKNFEGNSDYAKTFLEGMSLSVTTIPFIDNYELYVGSEKLDQLGGYSFKSPVKRPEYFNVDMRYIK